MNDDETDGDVVELEREQRIRRKVRSLGEDIEAAGEAADFADDPEGYLQRKAATVENDQHKQTYSVSDTADVFGVDPESVRRWIRRGDLKASKVGRGYRISRHDLREFYQQKGGGQLFDNTGGEPMALEDIEREARDVGREVVNVTADPSNLDPDNFPMPGDWRWLRTELGREPDADERETFREAYLEGFDEARREAASE